MDGNQRQGAPLSGISKMVLRAEILLICVLSGLLAGGVVVGGESGPVSNKAKIPYSVFLFQSPIHSEL